MTQITAVIITLNEERNIGRCLNSLKDVVDEIIVVDSGSVDRTEEICAKHGVRFVYSEWAGYAAQKNVANGLASHPYILSMDADEELSIELRDSIIAMKTALSGVYGFHRLTNYCGHWVRHGGWYPDTKWRLFPKETAVWEGDFVHEELNFKGKPEKTLLKGDLLHYSYSDTGEHRARADKYSALTAKKLFNAGKKASWLKPSSSAVGRWIKMYLLQSGFRDGWAGRKIASISAASNVFKYRELRRLHRSATMGQKIKTIALSRTDSIGDVMLTLPMAGIIKSEWPDCRIVFIGRSYTEAVIRSCEHIDSFIDFDDLSKLSKSERTLALKSEYLDALVHVFPRREMAAWAKWAEIPRRIGTGRRWYHLFYCNYKTWYSRRKSDLHEAELNVKLLEKLNLPTYYGRKELARFSGFNKFESVPEWVKSQLNTSAKNIILHPKSRGSAVEWSIQDYAVLAERLAAENMWVFITGTEAERALIGEHFPWSNPQVTDLTGKLSLSQLIAFISACDCLVAASTGPLHIAAACGIQAIGLYTPEKPMHPGRWSPIGKRVEVLTAVKHPGKGESLSISPDAVFSLILNH